MDCWCTWQHAGVHGTRKRPQSDIELGHRSSSCCLLGNVALRSKEHLEWDVPNQQPAEGRPRSAEAPGSRVSRALEADRVSDLEARLER